MELYIVIIQLCLLIWTFLVGWCEMSKMFADTLKSSLARFSLATSLIVLGFYAKFLVLAPYVVVFSAFIVCVLFTALFLKLLIHEHDKRVNVLNYRKSRNKEINNVNQ